MLQLHHWPLEHKEGAHDEQAANGEADGEFLRGEHHDGKEESESHHDEEDASRHHAPEVHDGFPRRKAGGALVDAARQILSCFGDTGSGVDTSEMREGQCEGITLCQEPECGGKDMVLSGRQRAARVS